MKTYKITYHRLDVVQYKTLISHDDYLRSKEMTEKEQKAYLKQLGGKFDFFTDRSGLFEAISTGILKMGEYEYPCTVEPIEEPLAEISRNEE